MVAVGFFDLEGGVDRLYFLGFLEFGLGCVEVVVEGAGDEDEENGQGDDKFGFEG